MNKIDKEYVFEMSVTAITASFIIIVLVFSVAVAAIITDYYIGDTQICECDS